MVLEEKLSAEQKNSSQLEAKLIEYKDYDNLKTELEKVRKELQSKGNEPKENIISETEYQELNRELQSEKEKNKVLAEKLKDLPPPISINEEIIKEIGEIINSAINPLRLEIIKLKKQSVNNSSLNSSSTELPTDYKEIKSEKEELSKL